MCKDKNGAKERFTYIFIGMKQSQCHFVLGFNTFRHLISTFIFSDKKWNEYTVTTNLIQPLTSKATQSQQDRIFCDTYIHTYIHTYIYSFHRSLRLSQDNGMWNMSWSYDKTKHTKYMKKKRNLHNINAFVRYRDTI